MAEESGAEKTHDPTPRRLEQARQEGRVLSSREAAVFVAMTAGLLGLTMLPGLAGGAAARWAAQMRLGPREGLDLALAPALTGAGWVVLIGPLVIALPVAAAAIAAQAAMGGLRWTPRNHAFRLDRIDPMAGLGRMFSARSLLELLKSTLKVAALGAVALTVLWQALPQLIGLAGMTPGDASGAVWDHAMRLLTLLTLVLGLIGAFDLVLQWRRHAQSLRMTLDEVRRESKEDNGSPEVKGRQRRLQREASQRAARERGSVAQVPQATAVIMNPSHFAVALRYVAGETAAPLIVAMGRDAVALQVRSLALARGIPVLTMPPLARALYFTGQIGGTIDERLYAAVAAVLAHLWRLERGLTEDALEVEVPPALRFDGRGRAA